MQIDSVATEREAIIAAVNDLRGEGEWVNQQMAGTVEQLEATTQRCQSLDAGIHDAREQLRDGDRQYKELQQQYNILQQWCQDMMASSKASSEEVV